MAKLTSYVHLTDEQGERHVFGPDDTVPDWAGKRITNKAVWEGSGDAAPDVDQAALAEEGRYEEMTHDGLQEEIRRRNSEGADLKVTGKKAELVALLRKHDEAE